MKSRYRTKTQSQSQALNGVCEAQKCFAQATVMVKVSAGVINGRQIAIPLSLCGNCVRKFDIIKEKEGEGLGLAPPKAKPTTDSQQRQHSTAVEASKCYQ